MFLQMESCIQAQVGIKPSGTSYVVAINTNHKKLVKSTKMDAMTQKTLEKCSTSKSGHI